MPFSRFPTPPASAASGPARRNARPGRVVLLRTAVALMGDKGYDGTSIRDIAAAAGVSVAALYHHFPSKLHVLREFMIEAHEIVLARLEREVDAAGADPRARLDAAVATLIASTLHDDFARLAAQVAWREHGRLEAPDRKVIAAKRDAMVDLIAGVITAGVQEGVFATSDSHEAARAIVTLCVSVVAPFNETNRSMDAAIELHQRLAVALANTPDAKPRRKQAGTAGSATRRSSRRAPR
jgi:AcrR family transcriptional regulator